jgi:hypothetical protein
MSTSDIVGWTVTLLIALGGWIFAWVQMRSNREENRAVEKRAQRQKKLDKIFDHLDTYAELVSLYRLYASGGSRIKKDKAGEFIRDKDDKPVVEAYMNEPEPRFDEALLAMQKADIKGAITQRTVTLRLSNGEVSDILVEFESDGNLVKKLGMLYYKTVDGIEKAIDGGDILKLVAAIDEANKHRQALRQELLKIETSLYEL